MTYKALINKVGHYVKLENGDLVNCDYPVEQMLSIDDLRKTHPGINWDFVDLIEVAVIRMASGRKTIKAKAFKADNGQLVYIDKLEFANISYHPQIQKIKTHPGEELIDIEISWREPK